MKRIIPVLFIFAFFGCQQPIDEEILKELTTWEVEPEEQPEETEEENSGEEREEEMAWEPESRHIYLYSETVEPDGTNYAKLYIAGPDDDYYWLYNAAKMKLESHNRDFPSDPWIIIGGGP